MPRFGSLLLTFAHLNARSSRHSKFGFEVRRANSNLLPWEMCRIESKYVLAQLDMSSLLEGIDFDVPPERQPIPLTGLRWEVRKYLYGSAFRMQWHWDRFLMKGRTWWLIWLSWVGSRCVSYGWFRLMSVMADSYTAFFVTYSQTARVLLFWLRSHVIFNNNTISTINTTTLNKFPRTSVHAGMRGSEITIKYFSPNTHGTLKFPMGVSDAHHP